METLTVYWSKGGNTRKVATALHGVLREAAASADILEITPSLEVDYYDYDLLLAGFPVYQFLPPDPVMSFLKAQQRAQAEVLPACPERRGKFAAVFCTYGGPHTGTREAVPALKYVGQFFEHAGIRVVDEWAVPGQFHDPARQRLNVQGRLGDLRGRPDERDIDHVCGRLRGLLRRLSGKLALELPDHPERAR